MGFTSEQFSAYQIKCATRKVEVIRRLTDALFDFLAHDYQETLKDEGKSQLFAAIPPSLEDLDHAMRNVERLQAQIDALSAEIENIPDQAQSIFRASMVFPVEQMLQSAKERVSEIQSQLEKAQSAPKEGPSS